MLRWKQGAANNLVLYVSAVQIPRKRIAKQISSFEPSMDMVSCVTWSPYAAYTTHWSAPSQAV